MLCVYTVSSAERCNRDVTVGMVKARLKAQQLGLAVPKKMRCLVNTEQKLV